MVKALVLVAATAVSQASPDADVGAFVARIERAVVMGDVQQLVRFREDLETPSRWRAQDHLRLYTLAYVSRRLVDVLPERDPQRQRLLKDSEDVLTALVAREPGNAEAHALLGSIYAAQITGAWKGMTLGPKAGKALSRAAQLAPDNPRVVLQQGITAFFRPRMFGGGVDKAEQRLRRAEELFSRQSPDAAWPNWGRVDVHAWLGRVLAKKGDGAGARAAYRKGLAMEPGHRWIRDVLLPELDQQQRRK